MYHSQGLGIPLLQTSTPMLSIFKINSPFMLIYKYNNSNEKSVFCKVYFRILTNNITCYILIFQLDNGELKTVVLMNNGIRPSVDLLYRIQTSESPASQVRHQHLQMASFSFISYKTPHLR